MILLLVAALSCVATTDIPEFTDVVSRACGERIKSVSFTGNHENAKYLIAYAKDLLGEPIAEMDLPRLAWQAAKTANEVLQKSYHMEHFEYQIVDSRGSEVCTFIFVAAEEKPIKGTCVDAVR